MKPGLALRVSQHLALTPQLQQSIRLLQLSTLELAQEVEQQLDDNPFLERADDDADGEAAPSLHVQEPHHAGDSVAEDASFSGASDADATSVEGQNDDYSPSDWEGDGGVDAAHSDGEWGSEAPRSTSGEGESDAFERLPGQESLAAHLHRQALALRLAVPERAALYFLIESLNDDGYLEDSLPVLADALAAHLELEADASQREELEHHLNVALRLLQSLEPAGVGARDLAECLQLQLRALQQEGGVGAPLLRAAQQLCAQPLELLARRDWRRLAQAGGISEDEARAALALIARLEPHPGRCFADVQRHALVPDVIVRKTRQGLLVQLNPDVVPRLRVHEAYAGALRGARAGAGTPALQQRLQEARWLIKNIQQRFDTILRVAQAIVERQSGFFDHGELAMRPLVLRDIAQALELHESTISRVTSAKYMATPRGTFEFKYFFGSGLGTEAGGNASSTAVRALIRQLIAEEDPAKPLSDGAIADLLKEQGIDCARRTVAKYREAMKIAPTPLRKQSAP